nr:FkbM family methyltransferase [Micromonospora sp. DSM 115978]
MNVFDSPEQNGWNSLGLHAMRTYGGEEIKPAAQVVVEAVTLDGYCDKHGIDYVDFLKVDVEGFEQNVFAGAHRMLKAGKVGTVCFELSEDPLVGEGISPAEVLSGLTDRGYTVYRLNPSGGLSVRVTDPWQEARR